MARIGARFRALTTSTKKFMPGYVGTEAVAYTVGHAYTVVAQVSRYPAKPPRSRYIRTFRLFRSWRVYPRHSKSGITVEISNAARVRGFTYSPMVHGPVGVQRRWNASYGWLRLDEHLMRREFRVGLQNIYNRYGR